MKFIKALLISFIFTLSSCGSSFVDVKSIELNKTSLNLIVDETTSLVATVKPDNATNKNVIWTSSNPDGLSINDNGLVSALVAGNYTVTCSSSSNNFVKATCSVNVSPKEYPVSEIKLNKYSIDIVVGQSETLLATVLPDNASDKSVTWTSSNPSGLSVSSSGQITALKAGAYTVSCISNSSPNIKGECIVNVKDKEYPVTNISLSCSSSSLYVDDQLTLTATIAPSYATNKNVKWESSNEKVVTVNENGLVVALSKGEADIKCSSISNPEIYATCLINVLVSVSKIELTSDITINVGDTYTLSPVIIPDNASDKSVSYSSDSISVASVDSLGVIKGKEKGNCKITCKANGVKQGQEIKAEVNVTVKESKETIYLPSDYYGNYYPNDFSWNNGEDLKNKLSTLMNSSHREVLGYNKPSTNWSTNIEADHSEYDFEMLDVVYSLEDIYYQNTNTGWQREHAFCASLMTGKNTSDAVDDSAWPRANDFQNLFVAGASGNSSRGNKNFGVAGEDGRKVTIKDGFKFDEKNFENSFFNAM